MQDKQRVVGKVLIERTVDGMKAVAERHGLIASGKIDLRRSRARFNHSGIDLREFMLDGCDLSGSVLTSCIGEGVSFRECVMKRVRIEVEKGAKRSFWGASFDGTVLEDATLGPRTLDLSRTTYRNAKLKGVTFQMGKLEGSIFDNAVLVDVLFRSAELNGATFREATLTRVSFEKATLEGANFTGAIFHQMEQWGEANFDGATISDELRYAYGIVRDPLKRITALIESGEFEADEVEALRRFRAQREGFLSNPEVMLILSECEDEIDPQLFVKMMKALKRETVN